MEIYISDNSWGDCAVCGRAAFGDPVLLIADKAIIHQGCLPEFLRRVDKAAEAFDLLPEASAFHRLADRLLEKAKSIMEDQDIYEPAWRLPGHLKALGRLASKRVVLHRPGKDDIVISPAGLGLLPGYRQKAKYDLDTHSILGAMAHYKELAPYVSAGKRDAFLRLGRAIEAHSNDFDPIGKGKTFPVAGSLPKEWIELLSSNKFKPDGRSPFNITLSRNHGYRASGFTFQLSFDLAPDSPRNINSYYASTQLFSIDLLKGPSDGSYCHPEWSWDNGPFGDNLILRAAAVQLSEEIEAFEEAMAFVEEVAGRIRRADAAAQEAIAEYLVFDKL